MDPLRRGFSDLLDDPKYSDLQIVCQGVTFHVHRNVACPQSKVIERECDGEWLEAGSRRIMNEVFEPLVVDRMLQYLYRGDYELRERFVGAARVEEMRVDGDAEGKVKEHPLIEHVRVYAVADYYDIPKLRDLAVERFEVQHYKVEESITPEELAHVASFLYANTTSSAHELRNQLLEAMCLSDNASYRNEEFMKILAERPELQHFSADLLAKVVDMHDEQVRSFAQERGRLRKDIKIKDELIDAYKLDLEVAYAGREELCSGMDELWTVIRDLEKRLRDAGSNFQAS